MPLSPILHGDKGYDSNAIRRKIEDKGAMPNIPPKANRRWKNCFSPFLYRDRNAIERLVEARTAKLIGEAWAAGIRPDRG